MKKTMKKVLALVLTVLMCVSVALPVVAADTATCPGAGATHTKKNCSYTEIKKVAVACGQDGYTLNQCTVCLKQFQDDIVKHTVNHVEKPGATVAPSCTQQGYKLCENCGEKYDVVTDSGKGHKYPKFENKNITQTYGTENKWFPVAEGKDCNYTHYEAICQNDWSKYATNDWSEYPITVGDCEEHGKKDYNGKFDDHHVWELVVDDAFVAPTCSVSGTGTFKCTVCDKVSTLAIEATGHLPTDYTVPVGAKAPTCTESGNLDGFACPECGEVREEDFLPALHDDIDPVTKYPKCYEIAMGDKATCESAGYIVYYCPECGKNEAKVEPALGHDRGELLSERAPTCKVPGFKVYEHACERGCDDTAVNASVDATTGNITFTITDTTAHNFKFFSYAANCTNGAYTVYECIVDGCDEFKDKVEDTTSTPITGAHVWEWSNTVEPTCTTTGTATAKCKFCDAPSSESREVPALGHKYYTLNDDGEKVFDDTYNIGKVYPSCSISGSNKNGYVKYACMNGCEAHLNAENPVYYKNYTEELEYDATNPAHHTTTKYVGVVEGSCTVKGYERYLCEGCLGFIDIYDQRDGYNGKHVSLKADGVTRVDDYVAAKDPSCDNPYTSAKEGVGNAEYFTCAKCSYVVGAYRDANGNLVKADGTATDKAVMITYTQLTHENLVNAKAPTCLADGYWATWDCSHCETKSTKDAPLAWIGNALVAVDEYVREALGHDFVSNKEGTEIVGVYNSTACEEYCYIGLICSRCSADQITGFKYNEHVYSSTLVEATCTEGAYYPCINCTDPSDRKYVSERLWHIDVNGKEVRCVSKKFTCHRCNVEITDLDETHDLKNTVVDPTCTAYGYNLWYCADCSYYYNTPLSGTDEFKLASHDYSAWTVTVEAEPGVAGKKERTCSVCQKVDSQTFGNNLYYNISIDNGVVAGAELVNSGLLKVTLKTTTANLSVWGLKFSLGFNNEVLAYEKFVVLNSSFKDNTIVATENTTIVPNPNPDDTTYVDLPETVNVVMTAPNTSAGAKQNVTLDGKSQGLVEVYFRILSNVGYDMTTNQGKATNVTVGVTDVEAIKYNANEDTVYTCAPVTSENVATGAVRYAEGTIFMLGDVTGDVATTTLGKIATMLDASALMEIYTKNGDYDAKADIDKNGKVDLADFAALMTYIADGKYNVLVANGVN